MRPIILLAWTMLAAAPAAVHAQSGGGSHSAHPSRPVDECGVQIARRARRNTEAAAAATQRQPPRLLGVRQDSAAATAGGNAASATSAGAGAGEPDTHAGGHGTTPAAGTHGGTAASPTHAGGQRMTPGSSANGAQGAASSTSGSGSAVMRAQDAGSATSSTSGAGQTLVSSTSAGGGQEAALATRDGLAGDSVGVALRARLNRAALALGATTQRVRLGPAASVSVPTALGVDAGGIFFGIGFQGRTRYTQENDGAAVIGFGVGTRRVLALEVALTTFSTLRGGGPFETGGLSFKVHREVASQTSLAAGWENAIRWGGPDDDGSMYAVGTRVVNLAADTSWFNTLVLSLGVGNGRFRTEADDAAGNQTVNAFAAAGLQVADPISLMADWTGQDLNVAASFTPVRRVPFVLTAGFVDITGNAGDGARFIFSLGYGLAFPQAFRGVSR